MLSPGVNRGALRNVIRPCASPEKFNTVDTVDAVDIVDTVDTVDNIAIRIDRWWRPQKAKQAGHRVSQKF